MQGWCTVHSSYIEYIAQHSHHFYQSIIYIILIICVILKIDDSAKNRSVLYDNKSFLFFEGIQKYQNNPTSTGLDTKDYPILNIDFPGITICPNTKVIRLGKLGPPASHYFSLKDHEKYLPSCHGIQTSALEKSDIKTGAGIPVQTTDLSQ